MECPKCNRLMEEGYIPIANMALYWSPKNEPPGVFRWSVPRGGVVLNRPLFIGYSKKESYFCRECDFVIVPTVNCERREK